MKFAELFKKYGLFVVLIVICVVFSVMTPAFFTLSNMMTVARQVSMTGIAAVGMMFVLLTGGIDLSIGSMVALVNVIGAWLLVNTGIPSAIIVIMMIALAAAFGLLQGVIITKMKVPPLICTMAFMNILSGFAFIITQGMPVYGYKDAAFDLLGKGFVGPIPVPVIIMVGVIALGSVILSKSYFGRYFYAIGGNEEAALLSGINVNGIKTLVYTLSGAFAGLAGIIMLSRLGSGQPITGNGFEFQVIIGVVLGGVSVAGGSGKLSGVVAGVLIIGVLTNGLLLVNVNEYVQRVIQGVVLVLAVGFDAMSRVSKKRTQEAKDQAIGVPAV